MSKQTWVHWVAAAILVVVAGVLIASAEERIEVKVLKESADAISVDVNGVTEVVRLEDLADGESRIFDVGDHELVVKRVGGDLTIVSDGHGLGSFDGHGKSLETMVWVGEDGEDIEIDCDGGKHQAKKIVVMTAGDQEAGEAKTYTIHVDGDEVLLDGENQLEIDELVKLHGGHHGAVFISEDGEVDHPMIVKTHEMFGNVVKYRCEETGSVLLVKKEDALQDTYICPATGCVMTKVEEPEVRVIKIEKRVESDE
jgi:nitrite reductase/ring-hydroxylating ferredoxin subunit